MTKSQILQAYADSFASMTEDNLNQLSEFLSEDVCFIDPFNKLHGKAEFTAIFVHMYAVMKDPKFTILDIASSAEAGYIKWRMTGTLKARPTFIIDLAGMSEVRFNKEGKICLHHDHWDSAHQLLQHIPFAGFFIKKLLRLFALPAQS